MQAQKAVTPVTVVMQKVVTALTVVPQKAVTVVTQKAVTVVTSNLAEVERHLQKTAIAKMKSKELPAIQPVTTVSRYYLNWVRYKRWTRGRCLNCLNCCHFLHLIRRPNFKVAV